MNRLMNYYLSLYFISEEDDLINICYVFLQEFDNLQSDHLKLKKILEEKDQTLIEMGRQITEAKLEIDTLKEEASFTSIEKGPTGQWLDDSGVRSCQICEKEFNISRRKVTSLILCTMKSLVLRYMQIV